MTTTGPVGFTAEGIDRTGKAGSPLAGPQITFTADGQKPVFGAGRVPGISGVLGKMCKSASRCCRWDPLRLLARRRIPPRTRLSQSSCMSFRAAKRDHVDSCGYHGEPRWLTNRARRIRRAPRSRNGSPSGSNDWLTCTFFTQQRRKFLGTRPAPNTGFWPSAVNVIVVVRQAESLPCLSIDALSR